MKARIAAVAIISTVSSIVVPVSTGAIAPAVAVESVTATQQQQVADSLRKMLDDHRAAAKTAWLAMVNNAISLRLPGGLNDSHDGKVLKAAREWHSQVIDHVVDADANVSGGYSDLTNTNMWERESGAFNTLIEIANTSPNAIYTEQDVRDLFQWNVAGDFNNLPGNKAYTDAFKALNAYADKAAKGELTPEDLAAIEANVNNLAWDARSPMKLSDQLEAATAGNQEAMQADQDQTLALIKSIQDPEAAISPLQKAQAEAVAAINALPHLTNAQKNLLADKVAAAKTEDEVKALVAIAQKANDLMPKLQKAYDDNVAAGANAARPDLQGNAKNVLDGKVPTVSETSIQALINGLNERKDGSNPGSGSEGTGSEGSEGEGTGTGTGSEGTGSEGEGSGTVTPGTGSEGTGSEGEGAGTGSEGAGSEGSNPGTGSEGTGSEGEGAGTVTPSTGSEGSNPGSGSEGEGSGSEGAGSEGEGAGTVTPSTGSEGSGSEGTGSDVEDAALEAAKEAANDTIDSLPNLSDTEKEGFKAQVEAATTPENVKTVVDAAKAQDAANKAAAEAAAALAAAKSDLEKAIAAAEAVKASDAYANDTAADKAGLDEALAAAKDALSSNDKAVVDAAKAGLDAATKAIDGVAPATANPGEGATNTEGNAGGGAQQGGENAAATQADKDALNSAIEDAKGVKDSDSYKNASDDKKAAFDAALDEAEKVYGDSSATSTQVKEVTTKLIEAQKALDGTTITAEAPAENGSSWWKWLLALIPAVLGLIGIGSYVVYVNQVDGGDRAPLQRGQANPADYIRWIQNLPARTDGGL